MALLMAQATLAQLSENLVYVFGSVGSMMLSYGIYQVITESKTSSRKRIQDRLRGRTARLQRRAEAVSILKKGARQTGSLADALLGRLSIVPKLQVLLDQADIPWSAAQTLLNLAGLALLAAIGLVFFQYSPLMAIGCGTAVICVPLAVLSHLRKRRMRKLTQQLPDVFDMMSQALRAGHSLSGAIQLVQEQLPPPIATEFGRVYHEQNLGIKIEEALSDMAKRVDSLDVRFFVTAVMIQRQTGGDLAEVLDNIAGVIRERIELQGLVRGLTAEGRLSGWVLFALPFVVFLGSLYMNPDYGNILLDTPQGQILLLIAGGMQLMGIAMIRWIVNIKI
ncbi:MAG: type II secretion system F family protein [Phycisphaerae bacterium]